MKQTDNKQDRPLWKVLNEKRTQGEWWSHSPVIKFPVHRVLCGEPPEASEVAKFFTATMDNADQQEANAQYTALAVNEFANVVEALESSMEEIKCLLCNYAGYSTNESYANYYGNSAIYLKAKEALSRIS